MLSLLQSNSRLFSTVLYSFSLADANKKNSEVWWVTLQLPWVWASVKVGMAHARYYEVVKNSLYEPGSKLLSRHRKVKIYRHHFKTWVCLGGREEGVRQISNWNKYPGVSIYCFSTF